MNPPKRLHLFIIFWILLVLFNPAKVFAAKRAPAGQGDRLKVIEDQLKELEAEVEMLKAQSRLLIQRNSVSFLDRTYLGLSFNMIMPRKLSFPAGFATDTGIGANASIGQYFSRQHVGELSLGWDIYPSASVKYRYEWHIESSSITLGPMVGFKIRLLPEGPFDNFIDRHSELKSTLYQVGFVVATAVHRNILQAEIAYWINGQSFIVFNLGIHIFI